MGEVALYGRLAVQVELISGPILGPRLIKGSSCIVEHRIVILYCIVARALLPGVECLQGYLAHKKTPTPLESP